MEDKNIELILLKFLITKYEMAENIKYSLPQTDSPLIEELYSEVEIIFQNHREELMTLIDKVISRLNE
ncbi:hypothetical protein [Streptococcus hyointestinalis]|uniref:hypothetical protein n=1 Tax=Streptococcus hyointestinalis TaxID=1337 RepID=UPI0013DF8A6F|nr:hypothetical protein [Streptococcus hyointestinalis]